MITNCRQELFWAELRRMPRMREPVLAACFALSAALLASCTGGGSRANVSTPSGTTSSAASANGSASAKPSPSASAPPVTQLWRTKLSGFAGAWSAGPAAVVIERAGQHLFVNSLDARTGKSLWRKEMSPSIVPPGIAVRVGAAGGHVAYLRPAPTQADPTLAQLVVADPHSGKDLVVSTPMEFSDYPGECDDTKGAICVQVAGPNGDEPYIVKPGATSMQPATNSSSGGYRSLGPGGIVDLLQRNPEQVARIRNGTVVWKKNLVDLFGQGFSTDYGWDWHLDKSGVYFGSVGFVPRDTTAQTRSIILPAQTATVGLRASDGKLLWRTDGTQVDCWGGAYVQIEHGVDGAVLPLRCRYKGVLTIGPNKTSTSGFSVTVERFDPRTGKAVWAAALGNTEQLALKLAGSAPVSDSSILVDSTDGAKVLDLKTGKLRDPAAGEYSWCSVELTMKYLYSLQFDSGPIFDRYGGESYLCDSAGHRVNALPTAIPITVSTLAAGGVLVVTDSKGVTGYEVAGTGPGI